MVMILSIMLSIQLTASIASNAAKVFKAVGSKMVIRAAPLWVIKSNKVPGNYSSNISTTQDPIVKNESHTHLAVAWLLLFVL
jgi:hypothetical protein